MRRTALVLGLRRGGRGRARRAARRRVMAWSGGDSFEARGRRKPRFWSVADIHRGLTHPARPISAFGPLVLRAGAFPAPPRGGGGQRVGRRSRNLGIADTPRGPIRPGHRRRPPGLAGAVLENSITAAPPPSPGADATGAQRRASFAAVALLGISLRRAGTSAGALGRSSHAR